MENESWESSDEERFLENLNIDSEPEDDDSWDNSAWSSFRQVHLNPDVLFLEAKKFCKTRVPWTWDNFYDWTIV